MLKDEIEKVLIDTATKQYTKPRKTILLVFTSEQLNQALIRILELVEKCVPDVIVKINEECDGCLNGSRCKVCGVQYFNQTLAEIKRRIG